MRRTIAISLVVMILSVPARSEWLPSFTMWEIEINTSFPVMGSIWNRNGNINLLIGVDNTVCEVWDGRLTKQSPRLPGRVTAVTRMEAGDQFHWRALAAFQSGEAVCIAILDPEWLEIVRIDTIGIWQYTENGDSLWGEFTSRYETVNFLKHLGGEGDTVIIAKSINNAYGDQFEAGLAMISKSGMLMRYSLRDRIYIDSTVTGGIDYMTEVLGRLVSAESSMDGGIGDMFYMGHSVGSIGMYSMNIHPLARRQIAVLDTSDYLWGGGLSCLTISSRAVAAIALGEDSGLVAAAFGNGSDCSLGVCSISDLQTVAITDMREHPISSLAFLTNREDNGDNHYLLCINPQGRIRLFNPVTPELTQIAYASRVGGSNVYASDYDEDGNEEMLGSSGTHLACARINHLSIGQAEAPLPRRLTLSAYPNPFNSSTTINYALPAPDPLRIPHRPVAPRHLPPLIEPRDEASTHVHYVHYRPPRAFD